MKTFKQAWGTDSGKKNKYSHKRKRLIKEGDKSPWSTEEKALLMLEHQKYGSKWRIIGESFPTRDKKNIICTFFNCIEEIGTNILLRKVTKDEISDPMLCSCMKYVAALFRKAADYAEYGQKTAYDPSIHKTLRQYKIGREEISHFERKIASLKRSVGEDKNRLHFYKVALEKNKKKNPHDFKDIPLLMEILNSFSNDLEKEMVNNPDIREIIIKYKERLEEFHKKEKERKNKEKIAKRKIMEQELKIKQERDAYKKSKKEETKRNAQAKISLLKKNNSKKNDKKFENQRNEEIKKKENLNPKNSVSSHQIEEKKRNSSSNCIPPLEKIIVPPNHPTGLNMSSPLVMETPSFYPNKPLDSNYQYSPMINCALQYCYTPVYYQPQYPSYRYPQPPLMAIPSMTPMYPPPGGQMCFPPYGLQPQLPVQMTSQQQAYSSSSGFPGISDAGNGTIASNSKD